MVRQKRKAFQFRIQDLLTLKMMPVTATKRIAPPKRLIYGPGPSMVDPRVYEAIAQPIVGIRDPYFLEIMGEIQSGLREVFGTANQKVFLVPGSGSAAMEAAVANFVPPGSKFAIFTAGHFANRMAIAAERHGSAVVRLEKAWAKSSPPKRQSGSSSGSARMQSASFRPKRLREPINRVAQSFPPQKRLEH